ncbi:HAD family hydrolase [Alteromonas alba]|uniref:HAD family hydrolase n=1 Tax=Alteromonas alba TaxID=2079529 RepID=A0A2S9VBT2_9ALTE|nr:HAD family hydrolase [Alteromonas alba]PRO73941.1 HAD family hydrolase [Alteromonas alba]
MVESVSLKEFGFNFCGPILHTYLSAVDNALRQSPKNVYCLAREGYILQKGLNIINSEWSPTYLYASRTFLFRITLSHKASWSFSLGHGYKGKLGDFFVSRFGFTLEQVKKFVDQGELDDEVTTLDDKDRIETILKDQSDIIETIIKPTRNAYIKYLASIGLTSDTAAESLFLDVGYSGTIQKLLSILLQSDTNGYYFITTDSTKTQAGSYTANLSYVFKDKVKMGGGYTMLDRSMFLEALFTSPDGQFIDIIDSPLGDKGFHFCFGKRNYTQHHFEKLNLIFDGALNAISHFDKHGIEFKVSEIEFLYEQYVSKRNLLPSASWPLFEFDDAISGFGNVNSMQFFGL